MTTLPESQKQLHGGMDDIIRTRTPVFRNGLMALAFMLASAASLESARAFSCWCLMDSQVVSTNWGKCGEQGCDNGPQLYLTRTRIQDFAIDNGCVDATRSQTETTVFDKTQSAPQDTIACVPWYAPVSVTTIGDLSYIDCYYDTPCDTSEYIVYTNNDQPVIVDPFDSDCDGYWGSWWTQNYTGLPPMTQTTCTSTSDVWTVDSNTNGYSGTDTTTWSNPYSDSDLNGDVKSHLPSYSGVWASGGATAYFSYCDTNHWIASGGKMKYRLKVPDSEKGASYLITWNEVTVRDGSTNVAPQTETITGTGDPVNPALGSEHEVDMPPPPSTGLSIAISETMPSVEKVTEPDDPGVGGGD